MKKQICLTLITVAFSTIAFGAQPCANHKAPLLVCQEATQPNDAYFDISMVRSFAVCDAGSGKAELVGVASFGAVLKGARAATSELQYDFKSAIGSSEISVTQTSAGQYELVVTGDAEPVDAEGRVQTGLVRIVRTYQCKK